MKMLRKRERTTGKVVDLLEINEDTLTSLFDMDGCAGGARYFTIEDMCAEIILTGEIDIPPYIYTIVEVG